MAWCDCKACVSFRATVMEPLNATPHVAGEFEVTDAALEVADLRNLVRKYRLRRVADRLTIQRLTQEVATLTAARCPAGLPCAGEGGS